MVDGIKRFWVIAGTAVVLAGCVGEPHIHTPEHRDRDHPFYAKTRADRTEVSICYAAQSTTPEEVYTLADEECRKYGRRAEYWKQNAFGCDLINPTKVTFACVRR